MQAAGKATPGPRTRRQELAPERAVAAEVLRELRKAKRYPEMRAAGLSYADALADDDERRTIHRGAQAEAHDLGEQLARVRATVRAKCDPRPPMEALSQALVRDLDDPEHAAPPEVGRARPRAAPNCPRAAQAATAAASPPEAQPARLRGVRGMRNALADEGIPCKTDELLAGLPEIEGARKVGNAWTVPKRQLLTWARQRRARIAAKSP